MDDELLTPDEEEIELVPEERRGLKAAGQLAEQMRDPERLARTRAKIEATRKRLRHRST